ncbi:MAG: TrkH family potassium uptake protein [Desulfopila sp.]
MKSRAYTVEIGWEGALMVLAPAPFLLYLAGVAPGQLVGWRCALAAASAALLFFSALTLFRRPAAGKLFAVGAVLAGYAAFLPSLISSPFAALAGSVCLIFIGSTLLRCDPTSTAVRTSHADRCLQRARWGVLTAPIVVVFSAVLSAVTNSSGVYCAAAAFVIGQALFLHWAVTVRAWLRLCFPVVWLGAIPFALLSNFPGRYVLFLIALLSLLSFLLLPPPRVRPREREERWWHILVNHPGRILISTFFLLCATGSLCLCLPAATTKGTISFLDAAFTSVSAVCVTGLIVLDTPNDFTLLGQIFIVILIQLGGLGIMSITTVALHAMGRRLSLKHERLLTSMTETSHRDLISSLGTILKFTFIVEGIGAVLLTLAFLQSGDSPVQAVWRGLFTAISAFCNAGFALQSESLIPFQTNSLVLHTVSLLIIFGGIAPATSLVIPRWLAGKTVPIPARLALITTLVLLVGGTLLILVFEWSGVLFGLSLVDKLQNAWFQSVTLRTAGFNSVDIAAVSSPTFLVMLFFMFVGGSPGGTAGGVKTVAIGVLAMTFWSNITNQRQIVTQHRRIHTETVYRAVTVVLAGAAVWSVIVIMLEVTQTIPARDILFEVTSALGTVGLSTGATSLLDEIGKVLIIIAMFVGRVGPVSMFMLLSDDQGPADMRYPVERVSIT